MEEFGSHEDLPFEVLGDLGNKPLQCANVPHQVDQYVGEHEHVKLRLHVMLGIV